MNKTQYTVKEIGISYDRQHYQRIEQYILQLQKLYLSAINEAATIVWKELLPVLLFRLLLRTFLKPSERWIQSSIY